MQTKKIDLEEPCPTCSDLEADQVELTRLERIIETGLAVWITVGRALLEINNKRLYRLTHLSWGAYCEDRWKIQRAHAYRLIQAIVVVDDLSPRGDMPLPDNERVARALGKVADPEDRREVWEEAVEEAAPDQPTAADVERISQRLFDELPPREQQAVLQAESQTRRQRTTDSEPVGDQEKRKRRALKHLHKARNPLVSRGDADGAVALIDQALAEVEALS